MKKTVIVLLLFALNVLFAQSTISGKITDSKTGEALIGANVFLKGTGYGAATDVNGNYEFSAPDSRYTFVVTYVGYVDFEENINVSGSLEKSVKMSEDLFSREVIVTAQRAKTRETPVPFTDVPVADIESRIATQDIPMLLNDVPGVYASETGGGAGDSRINIRGFSTENLNVMINGVPVNDMENGVVYWSNWSGLGDVTSSIQIQRGLGASKLSTASVGGTVNLLTKSTDATRKTIFKSEVGAYNTQKYTAAFSTGLMENNLALSMMISRKTGDGYVENTWSNDFVYFISIGKIFDDHVLNINFTGTPQNHGQRTQDHSTRTYAEKGLDWNSDWGYLQGRRITVRENFYHKPVLDINHIWKMNESTTWTNVLYGSWGTGGGTGDLRRSVSGHPSGSYLSLSRETNQINLDS
ncbi:MAG: carboxypeptidase-like regulatory domain-containing protein, partial [Calditrichaeota bacterium]|nr:carboxypeptidase-like regulatory domain-containing protein [Calditrichota bacterium]